MGQSLNELAQMFRERDNTKQIGTMVGTIISTNPISVRIGKITLSGGRLVVAECLTDRKETVELKKLDSAEWYVYEIAYKNILKLGDRVIVCPTEDKQTFIIVDKVGGR